MERSRPLWTTFEEWFRQVPAEITGDALWQLRAYQFALFAADLGWHDVSLLARDARTVNLAGQLYRSLGSIGANVAEGYSRMSRREKARFYEYSFGSARESRHWYYEARYIIGEDVSLHRLTLLTEIIRLLTRMVSEKRTLAREPATPYDVEPLADEANLDDLLITAIPYLQNA